MKTITKRVNELGRKSQERMTGKTLEERTSNPNGYEYTEDAVKVQKKMNSYLKIWKKLQRHLHIQVGKAES